LFKVFLGFKSGFMYMFWTSKLSFYVDILAILGSASVWATFFQNLGDFFGQSSGHPVCEGAKARQKRPTV
jgi:hypothetical protein